MYYRIVKKTGIEIEFIDCNLGFLIREADQKLFLIKKVSSQEIFEQNRYNI